MFNYCWIASWICRRFTQNILFDLNNSLHNLRVQSKRATIPIVYLYIVSMYVPFVNATKSKAITIRPPVDIYFSLSLLKCSRTNTHTHTHVIVDDDILCWTNYLYLGHRSCVSANVNGCVFTVRTIHIAWRLLNYPIRIESSVWMKIRYFLLNEHWTEYAVSTRSPSIQFINIFTHQPPSDYDRKIQKLLLFITECRWWQRRR